MFYSTRSVFHVEPANVIDLIANRRLLDLDKFPEVANTTVVLGQNIAHIPHTMFHTHEYLEFEVKS